MFIRACFFFASLCLTALSLPAQEAKSDAQLADDAYASGNYDLALYAYNRLAFEIYPEIAPRIEMQIGHCYLGKGDFENASRFFDRAFFSSTETALKNSAVLNKTRALIGQMNYPLALNELYSLQFQTMDSLQASSYYLFKAVCLYEMGQFEAAEQDFLALVTDSSTIEQLFSRPKEFYRPNSTLALVMSAIVPGTGQFYANEYREGVNSVIINSIFVYSWIRTINLYGAIDAFIAVLPWFQRYYVGGFNKASLLAYERMLTNRKAKLAEILTEIDRQNP